MMLDRSHTQPCEKVNILLVDDKPGNLIALTAILEKPTYNLVTARSGAEALARLVERDYAVILLDVMMPEMDGFELASVVKKQQRLCTVPIIFLTAAAHDLSYIYKAYSLGGVDYLQKPLDPNVVRAKVAVFVDLFQKSEHIKFQNELIRDSERREQDYRLKEVQRRNDERYRKLADAIPHIVWIATADGNIEYFNARWSEYTGLNAKDFDGWKGKLTPLHPDDVFRFKEQWLSSIENGCVFDTECRLKRSTDGQYRWHLCRALPETDGKGEVIAWLGTFTDIENKKQSEEELIVMREAAETANKAKSEFLANMSHEIRTPLGAILGFAELILDDDATSQERLDWVDTIKRNCQHLSRLVDEILDLSKIEARQLLIEPTRFQLEDVINEIKSLLTQQAHSKGLYINFKMPKALEPIKSDPARLRQILINVIGNAIKFTEKGGVNVQICPVPAANGDTENLISFIVSDTGPGMTTEQSKRLFQPFMQADKSTARKFGGTGLGLALSRRLAYGLDGDLVLTESSPGNGTTFTLTINASLNEKAKSVATAQAVAAKKPLGPLNNNTLNGTNVLLVEDTIDNQILVTKFLELAGAHVDLAQNGFEGVEMALAGKHDVVLMDIQMPGLDGYEATSQLRVKGYEKPIIALTAHAMKGEKERCVKAGYNDYLPKPLNRLKLIETITHYITLPIGSIPPAATIQSTSSASSIIR